MSVDNILAIAGASKGDFWLILFGLAVSIPFIVLSSNLLSRLMDRWPALILIGSGILGKVAGEMIMTDPVVRRTLAPGDTVRWIIEGGLTAAVIVFGWRRTKDGEHRIPTSMRPGPSSKASRVPCRRKS
jgi:predicted tellurium resistance membrane protein TerC